jgi:Fic family protein
MKKIETPPQIRNGIEGFIDGLSGLGAIMQKMGHVREKDSNNSLFQFSELIDKCNKDYLYWDKVKYQPIPSDILHEQLWTALKSFRQFSSKKISFNKYDFSYFVTPTLQELLHKFDLELGGQFGGHSVLPEQDKNQYLISSIMEEAIASSQIEGAVTTRKVAKEMLRKNQNPKDRSQQMILNNYQTIRYLSEIKFQNMTPELLCEIQSKITKNALDNPEYEGKFRDSDDVNIVDSIDGEIVHTPPKADELNYLINTLCEFFNEDVEGNFIHPIIKACILHFMIAYIHPFVDGNGRTSRTIFYWYLLKKRYWLVEYLSISRIIAQSKNKYYKAFIYTETDDNDLTYFIHYQLNTLKQALESLQNYISKKVTEKRQMIDFQKLFGVNLRQAIILKELHDNPDWIFNVKEIENRNGVSNQTARMDIIGLIELGYIEVSKINAKEQKYYKSSQFDDLVKKGNKMPKPLKLY